MTCECRMVRVSSAFELDYLSNLTNTYYCEDHNRYHYCARESDCVYRDGVCVYSGKMDNSVNMVLRMAGYINTDNLTSGEMKMLQFKDKASFRDFVHETILVRHAKALKGSLKMVTTPIMESVLAGLYHTLMILFMPTREEQAEYSFSDLADLTIDKKLKRFDEALLKICDLFVEAALRDSEAKQEILFRMHQEPRPARELRTVFGKPILAILTGNVDRIPKPLV
uniref:ORF12 n=1 Tax=Malaco herpesvirus 1 TaxID=3031797 RepID=A0AA48P7Q9_9VIRU|nr:TPA_asm: ORF12 [Malaco herpesvirus 1]